MAESELKPVRCGCGGEAETSTWTGSNATILNDCTVVYCSKCGIKTRVYVCPAEAIEAWNRAMSGNVKYVAVFGDMNAPKSKTVG